MKAAPTQLDPGQPPTRPLRKKATFFGWLCTILVILICIFIAGAAVSSPKSSPPATLVAAIVGLFLVIIGWTGVSTIIDLVKAYKQNPRKVLIALGIAGAIILVILAAFGFIFGKSAKADGGIFPHDRYTTETNQRAFIYYNADTENLVVTTSYKGNSSDFAWVIPVPNKPEIFKSSDKLFATLQNITETSDNGPVIYEKTTFSALTGAAKSQPVEVVEEKTVDIYDTTVLKATDGQALAKWLIDHGYTFPTEKTSELKSYIDQGWYFAIAKIKPSEASSSEVQNKLAEGTITPLRLAFKTSQLIYPMKLTRLSLDYALQNSSLAGGGIVPATSSNYPSQTMYIALYVLTDGKTTQTALDTKWANWISVKEIKELNGITGETWISGNNKLFLTKLANTVSIKDISGDFVVTTAADSAVFPVPPYKTASFWLINAFALLITLTIAILSPVGLLFILFAVLQKFVVKRKWLYVLLSIYEFLACLGAIGLLLIVIAGLSEGFSKTLLEDGFVGFLLGILILVVVGFYFSVKMTRRPETTAGTTPNPAKL